MAPSNVSSQQFVGRSPELATYRALLRAARSGTHILNLYGDGGMGKTWLLEEFRRIVSDEFPETAMNQEFIDFYFTANQHEFGVLRNIATQLDPSSSHFTSFQEAMLRYEREMEEGVLPLTPEVQQDLRKAVYDCFAGNLHELSHQKQVVLLFDTAEEADQAIVDLAQYVLPRMTANLLIVIAGRQRLALDNLKNKRYIKLKGFPLAVAIEYYRGLGFEAEDISDSAIERLRRLSGNGQPILMALAAGLLQRYPVEQLLALRSDRFAEWLVERVTDLGRFENLAILFMAHVWRRFDATILAHLSNESPELCRETIQDLAQQVFVKYRPGQMDQLESCLLHDKMRDLVNKHLWPKFDRSGTLRRELSGKMVEYYDRQLSVERPQREQQVLRCEQLYYLFDYDLETGFNTSRDLFEDRSHMRDIGYCAAINAEVGRFLDKLPAAYQREHQFRQGWMFLRREQHQEAIRLWEDLQVDGKASQRVKARALTYLVEAYADNSEFQEAAQRGKRAIEFYDNLIVEAAVEKQRTILKEEKGLLYNNLGFMQRKQERWQDAIDSYEEALECGGPPWQDARIRNNLGYTQNLLGRSELAFSYCQAALRIRKFLGAPYELGLSYNTLGILCVDNLRIPEADAFFQKAISAFEHARSERGRALVYTALGRLYRQWGWYEEHVVGQMFNPNRQRYVEAASFLEEAVQIYGKVQDEAGEAEALGELGCTFRERRMWDRATETLARALETAQAKGLRRREADILQDLSITHWRAYLWSGRQEVNLQKAEIYAKKAVACIQTAEEQAKGAGTDTVAAGYPYLLSKAQWALGDVSYELFDYDDAFLQYAEACFNVTRLDPQAISHDSAKKKLHYEDLVEHVVSKILALPDRETVERASGVLIAKWKAAKLDVEFRGFVENIEAASKDYELLKGEYQGASNVMQ